MAWVKTLPCVVCCQDSYESGWVFTQWFIGGERIYPTREIGRSGPTEFAHIGGNSAAKSSNMHGIPLCTDHHRSGKPYCQEVLKRRFGAYHGIDVEELIGRLVSEFRAQRAAA